MQRPTIELVFFDAGGGHRNAMRALLAVIAQSHPHWRVQPVNLQERLQAVDPVFITTRVSSENVYNAAIARGWTWRSRPFLRAMQKAIRLQSPMLKRELALHWRRARPDMVVSLVPNFNAVMFEALNGIDPLIPYVTVMTDIADTPPHFWQEPQDQFMICGSDKAFLQARLSGFYRTSRVFRTSGMILNPSFYNAPRLPPLTRADLGLREDRVTVLVMFGGNGSTLSSGIVERIQASGLPLQVIVLCGRNEELLARLSGRPHCHAVGFTDRVADYMRLADIFIGKPGPGSLSEAQHMGLPAIVELNARTLVQERYNPVWLEERGVGLALPSFSEIDMALALLLSGTTLAEYRTRALAIRNTAVFEIPGLLQRILEGAVGKQSMGHAA